MLGRNKLKVFLALIGVLALSGAIYASSGSSVKIEENKGLVAHWSMDNKDMKSDTVLGDLSPYGSDGTLVGRALASRLAVDRKTQANSALSFDGSTDYISASDKMLPSGASPRTVSLWANTNTLATDFQSPFSYGTYSNSNAFILRIAGGKFGLLGHTTNLTGLTSLTANRWYHLTITYDGTTAKLYANGVLDNSGNLALNTLKTGTMTIGDPLSGNNFNGSVDDVRIYNRALSQAEITKLYDNYQPKVLTGDMQKGLIGYWDFEEIGTTYYDRGYNSNNATSTADYHTDSGKVGKGVSLNGTQILSVANSPSLQQPTPLTLAGWFYFNSLSSPSTDIYLIHKFEYKATLKSYNSKPSLNIGGEKTGNTTMLIGRWYHIAATCDSSGVKIYLNGVLDGSNSTSCSVTSASNPWYLGGYTPASPRLNGKMDEIRIYNRALSASEIYSLAGSPPKILMGDLNKGLLGYWSLDSDDMKSASTTADMTPYNHDGELYGRSLASRFSSDRKSIANKTGSFNGSTDWIDLTSAGNFAGLSELTISFWQKAIATTNQKTWVSTHNSSNQGGFVLKVDLSRPAFMMATNSGSAITSNYVSFGTLGVGPIVIGQWQHVALVFNGAGATNFDKAKIYVDGVNLSTSAWPTNSVGTIPTTITATSVDAFRLARGYTSLGSYFQGDIDEFRIYNRALSADEIKALYEQY